MSEKSERVCLVLPRVLLLPFFTASVLDNILIICGQTFAKCVVARRGLSITLIGAFITGADNGFLLLGLLIDVKAVGIFMRVPKFAKKGLMQSFKELFVKFWKSRSAL